MYYKQVELKEGEPVLFVGCHVLKWPYDVQLPDVGFVEADDVVEELLEVLQQVEWTNAIDGGVICPWCGNRQYDGHHQGCPRQAAVAKAEGREP